MPNLIDQLKELDAKRTKGAWSQARAGTPFANNRVWPPGGRNPICSMQSHGMSPADLDPTAQANAAFIAATANALPALIEAVEALSEIVASERTAVEEWEASGGPKWTTDHPAYRRLQRAEAALKALEQTP